MKNSKTALVLHWIKEQIGVGGPLKGRCEKNRKGGGAWVMKGFDAKQRVLYFILEVTGSHWS